MNHKKQEQQVSNNKYNYQPVSIINLWGILVRSKIIIIFSTILFSILSIIYALTATPIYRAELLMVAAQGSASGLSSSLANQYGSIASMVGINLGGSNQTGDVERALAILQSRTFTEQYINEKNLMPILFADDWDEKNNTWKDEKPPSSQEAYAIVRSMLSINWAQNGLITVSIEWTDPQFAATWANETISRLNVYMRNQAIEETEKNIYFLEEQSNKTSLVNAQNVLYNLIEEQTKNIMLANVKEEYAFKVIDPAVAPERKIKPKRREIVMTGFILGLSFGLAAVFIREFFDNIKKSSNTT